MLVVKKTGNCPYIFPNIPLIAPKKTREDIIPLQKLTVLNLLFLLSEPPMYATVIGNKDKEQGPRLVKSPAEKINNTVKGPG